MKQAKIKFYKRLNAIIGILLAFMGFASSCDDFPNTRAEYGTPSAKFIVNGTVSSKESNSPINNIRVIMNNDTAYTDSEGQYQVIDNSSFPGSQTFLINFNDIDSTENGEFKDLDTTIEFIDPKFVNGDGNWYAGETSREFNVKLDIK